MIGQNSLEIHPVSSSRREVEAAGKLGLDITDIIENLPSQIEAAESILERFVLRFFTKGFTPALHP